jgi:hypothetical protein
MVLIDANKGRERLTSNEIGKRVEIIRKKYSLETKGLAESNIRRQLKRLRDGMLVDKQGNDYYLHENESLSDIFENNIEKFIVPQIMERVKEYLEELDNDK